jgi:solute carrier family 25 carnitine/acylcarnitine transporter 20/29
MSKSSVPSVHDLPSAEELKQDAVVATKETFASLRSLVSGGAGGVCAVVVGHPFDLVKVRLQTAQAGVYSGAMDVVRKTVAKEGLVRVCISLPRHARANCSQCSRVCMLVFLHLWLV